MPVLSRGLERRTSDFVTVRRRTDTLCRSSTEGAVIKNRWARVGILAAGTALLASTAAVPTAGPAVASATSPAVMSGDTTRTKIAYEAQCSIYIRNPEGDGKRRLTHRAPRKCEMNPTLSYDGRFVAYERRKELVDENDSFIGYTYDLRVLNLVSGQITLLTNNGLSFSPSFSPTRNVIAFRSGNSIYTMKVDGTGRKRWTNDPGSLDYAPSWTGRGNAIYFSSNRAGYGCTYTRSDTGLDYHADAFQVFKVFPKGRVKQITDAPRLNIRWGSAARGKSLAYSAQVLEYPDGANPSCEGVDGFGRPRGNTHLYVDGNELGRAEYGYGVDWSDTGRVVFLTYFFSEIATIAPTGGKAREIFFAITDFDWGVIYHP